MRQRCLPDVLRSIRCFNDFLISGQSARSQWDNLLRRQVHASEEMLFGLAAKPEPRVTPVVVKLHIGSVPMAADAEHDLTGNGRRVLHWCNPRHQLEPIAHTTVAAGRGNVEVGVLRQPLRFSDCHLRRVCLGQQKQQPGDIPGCRTEFWFFHVRRGKEESGRLDSNQRPLEPHSSALPSCATARRWGER